MDSFELNKIIGAILGTLLFVMGIGFIADAIYHPIEGRGPGYTLPEPEATEAAAEEGAVEEPTVPLGVLLASASAEQGATAARKCQSCHNFEEGAGNKQGPALYDVVGRLIGGVEGFNYSEAFVGHREAGDTWTYEALDSFLAAPKSYIPGTNMNFAGVRNDQERANIVAYLGSLSANPVPFPPADIEPTGDTAAEPAEELAPEGIEAVPEDAPVFEREGQPVATPTETQTDTPVRGTPIQNIEPGAAGESGADGSELSPPAAQ